MQSINSLINQLRNDFPDILFEKGDFFSWSPIKNTVYYSENEDIRLLIHELAHAVLGHTSYDRDIELIKIETTAWEKTKELAEKYQINIDDDFIQSNLDTYREWIHQRSICPDCHSNGLQFKKDTYECVVCRTKWTVNDSKFSALRRHKTK